ncbi:hypothetical protein GCM10009087_19060 [Sphingomonas oligophenolica]|uniref:Uncharacterized protein n=1 Tax=Sphingomonas oligophenolica TaxID=301154 RepID=A0ABU9Y391_9SPHN
MPAASQFSLTSFIVDVDFFCDDERYGTETYTITAASRYQAEQDALQRSGSSIYDDDRIPDRRRRANAREA